MWRSEESYAVSSVLLACGILSSVPMRPQLWADPECRADSWLNSLTFLSAVNRIDRKSLKGGRVYFGSQFKEDAVHHCRKDVVAEGGGCWSYCLRSWEEEEEQEMGGRHKASRFTPSQ